LKIIVVSDTHKNIALFKRALEQQKGDILFHLGDNYEDSRDVGFRRYCKSIYQVPGIYHEGYFSKELEAIIDVEINDWDFTLVHNLEEVDLTTATNRIVFYGHTHIQKIEQLNNCIVINPGHLKKSTDRGQKASYIVLEVEKELLEIKFYELEKGLVKHFKLKKTRDNIMELNNERS